MHFSALRRDWSNLSSDMAVSFMRFRREDSASDGFIPRSCSGPYSGAVAGAQIPQQPHQAQQLVRACIGDGAILQVARPPKDEVITVAGRIPRQRTLIGGPTAHIDDVLFLLIRDPRRALMIQVICAPANESIALLLEVGDDRRYI